MTWCYPGVMTLREVPALAQAMPSRVLEGDTMTGYGSIALTETERACGVSHDTAVYLARRSYRMPPVDGHSIVVETMYGPAVAAVAARIVNGGKPVAFLGVNSLGHSVYATKAA